MLAAALVALTSFSAAAAPITIDQGKTVIWNFDFSGQPVPGPYDEIRIQLNRTNFDAGDQVAFKYFDGLDGTGAASSTIPLLASQQIIFQGGNPTVVDGVFSLALSAVSGSVTYDLVGLARFFSSNEVVATVAGTVPGVPEPASLALSVLALAGLALASRRRAA